MLTRDEMRAHLEHHPGLIDVHTHVGCTPVGYARKAFPYAIMAEDQAIRGKLLGIDYIVTFPFTYTSYFDLHAFKEGMFKQDPEGAPFPFREENECLLVEIYDTFPRYNKVFMPFMFFDPSREPKAQAEWIADLATRYPVYGLKTATSYLQSPITDLLNDDQPLLELAKQLDVPFMIHTALLDGDPWANVFEILKVVEARPDIRFCLAHTCRFDKRALDRCAELPNCWVDFSAFNIHTQLVLRGSKAVASEAHRFPTDYADHAKAMGDIADAYPDTMMWGSDTPAHYFINRFYNERGERIDVRLECDYETETDELHKLPESTIQRITYTNILPYLFGN